MLAYRTRDPRDAYGGLLQIKRLYESATPEGRVAMRQVIVAWLNSDDSADRYDGLWLTDELKVMAGIPRLRELLVEAEQRTDHEAPYEWSKLNGILGRVLGAPGEE